MADPPPLDLIQLCERALDSVMEREELQRRWPEEPSDPQLAELRETLFSAIEHRLGDVVDGQWIVDPAYSRITIPEYDDIELYLQRLRRAWPS